MQANSWLVTPSDVKLGIEILRGWLNGGICGREQALSARLSLIKYLTSHDIFYRCDILCLLVLMFVLRMASPACTTHQP